MPTLIDKTPPTSFARRKFIDPVRTKRTQNADLEPTELTVLKHNKTLPQGVSVKPQVDLYKSLDPGIVPDVPASYIPQPDRHFQTMLAEPDLFHKYQTTQRDAEASVGFFLDQELRREMAETNLDPYMYSRKQQKLDNEINRLIAQPNRRLTPQEIFALENRILGGDPRLLPDYASLSYIVRHSALLDFIRDRKIFENMTAWKTSFMNVLNNTFARLRISKPQWFIDVLAENGRGVTQTMTAHPGHPGTTGVTFPPMEPSAPARTTTRRPDGEREIVHAPPTAPVPPAMEVPVQAPIAPAQEAEPVQTPVMSVTAGGPPGVSPGVGNRTFENIGEAISSGFRQGAEFVTSLVDPIPPKEVGTTSQEYDVAEIPEEIAGIRTQPQPTPGQQMMTNFFTPRPTAGPAEIVASRPIDIVLNGFSNSILNAIKGDPTSSSDKKLMDLADKVKNNEVASGTIHEAVSDIGRGHVPTRDIFDAIAYLKTLYQKILEILTRERGHLYDARNVLTKLDIYESKKKKP